MSAILLAHFRTDDEALFFSLSQDADDPARVPSFAALNGGVAIDRPSSGTMRDPALSPAPIDGWWYLAFTRLPHVGDHHHTPTGPVLGLRRSRDLLAWEDVGDGTLPVGMPGLTRCWAPKWTVDDDGIHLVFSGCSAEHPTPFAFYELHPLGDPAGAWSAAAPLVGDFPADRLDAVVVRHGDAYVCVYKNRLVHELEIAVAPSLLGPYAPARAAGCWGMQEGPFPVRLADGRWRLFFDWPANAPGNYRYADSHGPHLATAGWSAASVVTSDSELRHGTMVPLPAEVARALA